MYLDTDELAQKLHGRSLPAQEVTLSNLRDILAASYPGHEAIDEPEQYRWFLIPEFPTADFGITLGALMEDAGDRAGQEQWQHDRIIDLLKEGEPAWPPLVTASGIILDGYHRIAAHRTLKDKNVEVVVAVRRQSDEMWDSIWNEDLPE